MRKAIKANRNYIIALLDEKAIIYEIEKIDYKTKKISVEKLSRMW